MAFVNANPVPVFRKSLFKEIAEAQSVNSPFPYCPTIFNVVSALLVTQIIGLVPIPPLINQTEILE